MNTIVHTTQQVYRQLVNATSRPGHVELITEEVKNYTDFSNAALLAAMTLFDNEVTFYTDDQTMKKELKVLTGGIADEDCSTSDFIVLKEENLKKEYFTDVLKGVLISPEKSAMLMIDIESIGQGQTYRLSGPGIKEATDIQLSLAKEWFDHRNEVCKEFPLGIDLMLTDKNNSLIVIPRTTKVEVL